MNLAELLTVTFTGLTAFGVLAAWWQARATLRISWGPVEKAYDEQETFPVLRTISVVHVVNPSNHPDQFESGAFDMHKPLRLKLADGEGRDEFSFFVSMSTPVIPPVSKGSRWECRLTVWDARRWMGKEIRGTITIRTLRKRIRQRIAFSVPPIHYSPATKRGIADIVKTVEEMQASTEDPSGASHPGGNSE